MAENTKVEWATHTFNPWIGCAAVHTGCANCYAKAMAGRLGVTWGPHGTRRRTAESTWRQVERWNRKAAPGVFTCPGISQQKATHLWPCPAVPDRPRVFPSGCDPFEDGPPVRYAGGTVDVPMADVRRDFFALIDRCPNLDFLLLTKRPENVRRMWPRGVYGNAMQSRLVASDNGTMYSRPNVWLLYSASDQQTLEARLPHLLACRDLVPVLGLSLEPLVGTVDLDACWHGGLAKGDGPYVRGLDWVIVGGESGPHARPMDLAWLKSIADQCAAANVPLFVKQDCGRKPGQQGRIHDSLWARKELPA